MVTTKYYVGLIFVILTLGTMMFNSTMVDQGSSSLNHNYDFSDWRPSNTTMTSSACSCHISDSNRPVYAIYGSGVMNVQGSTTIEALTQFAIQFKVTGFTQANSGKITIGLNSLDDDNALFTNNQTTYQPYITVDSSGNSNYVSVSLTSPFPAGNYSLLAYAVYGGSSQDFHYLSTTVNMTVTPVIDTTPPVINSVLVNNKPYTQNMVIQGNTSIDANVTDQYLSSVQYSTDNTTFKNMNLNASTGLYQTYVSSNSFSGKSLFFTILANDKGGNNATEILQLALNNTGLLPNSDIITYEVSTSIDLNDQAMDPVWTNVPKTSIAEFGTGGFIKTVQDGTYLYTLMAYDSSYNWIAVEFNVNNSNEFMGADQDAWVFGTGASTSYHGEYHFLGMDIDPTRDNVNDLFYETFVQGSLTYVETARLLATQDPSGFDYTFTVGRTFNAVFASNVDHTGDHKIMSWTVTDVSPVAGNQNSNTNTNPIASSFNMQQISDFVFVLSFVIVIVTVFMHIGLRVVSRPITHEKRIIYTDKIPNHPTSTSLIKNFIFKPKNKSTEEKK